MEWWTSENSGDIEELGEAECRSRQGDPDGRQIVLSLFPELP